MPDKTYKNDLFLRAARGEMTPRPPIWLMRQAGRTDPEYNKLKAESGMTLEELFHEPEMAARISLLPKRSGVDALIYFQDILTPLTPMGAPFYFGPGPVLDTPIKDAADLERLHVCDAADTLPFIPEIFRLVKNELAGEMPVLGFSGAPFTLAVFIIEGGSFADHPARTHDFMREQPKAMHALLDKLATVMIDYLKLQIEAGADAVQLFESAAHLLDAPAYREFALPYQQRIFDELAGTVPSIMFARELEDLTLLDASGADILSLPTSTTIADAREILGQNRIIQGNLDNRLLVDADQETIKRAALSCIESGGCKGHIFNLSHGLLKETPYDHVRFLIDTVRAYDA